MQTLRRSLIAPLLLPAVLLASCGGGESVSTPTVPAGEATTATRPVPSVSPQAVYVLQAAGSERLIATPVPTQAGPKRYGALLARVFAHPDSPVPQGTVLRSARTRGDVLVVDVSTAFAAGYPTGGAAADNLVLGAIVFTITRSFPEIRGVQMLVEGQLPDVSSQYDLSAPLTADDLPTGLLAEE
jgi:Sporulation and spore germination